MPVDLNAYLYRAEHLIAGLAERLCDDAAARHFAILARRRRAAIARHLWSPSIAMFSDHDWETGEVSRQVTAAALAPLFAGCASRSHAAATARGVADHLLAAGGLRTTLIDTGEQWDWPNGWAPLQWIAFSGLRRYGYHALARTIAERWCTMVGDEFARTGFIHEKYDVERRIGGLGGEYEPQEGFGWTNGVTATLLDALGVFAATNSGRRS